MGLKPTQYRCAAESLLRRYRREGTLPEVHPLVDLCNAMSLAYAMPMAVLDADEISGPLIVRYADGGENYSSFSGDTEHPYAGEVIFADQAGNVTARRWCHRQSAQSAVSAATKSALIVAEAMHESARSDVERLMATAAEELSVVWPGTVQTALLSRDRPRFDAGISPSGSQP
jgi:DNA/RNA-binding domain of Phe-tRNA-synthetase-like protein